MVILVTGANGQLGQSIKKVESNYPEFTFIYQNSQELDITNLDSCKVAFEKYKPQYCINTAAYTAVDKAESESEKAFEVNVNGPKNLAQVCAEYDTVLVHVSTDFIFDGTQTKPYVETDTPNPTSVYGLTKLQGEQAIEKSWAKHYIIRTSWVFSEFGNNFMKTMIRLGNERDSLSVVNDQKGTPTYAPDLADALLQICKSNNQAYGIYNYSNEGECTWFEFAQEIFNVNNISIDLNPIPTTAYPTPAKRPAYSVLNKEKIKNTFNISIAPWQTRV
jgi:dTDP-4-dehydrorhamnose reductase